MRLNGCVLSTTEIFLTLVPRPKDLPTPFHHHSLGNVNYLSCGPGSSVGIATGYGVDGPGSNPSGDEIFRPSRPALRPTQPPIKWVPGLSRG